MLADFLKIAKSNEHELKKSFLVALRQLLAIKISNKDSKADQRQIEILYLIFSNLA